ncbi:hypothetical protein Tco_0307812 [Tanacetum coccineum]
MVCVPRRIIQHSLNVNLSITLVAHKQRVLGPGKSKAVMKEVEEWIKAGIVRPVRYPPWIFNPILVKKIEAVMGFPFKCFLDTYKGYHQIQMSKEDEDKTAFYTDQGTYCYNKMSFGLKNAGATYQRLVDSAFQVQLGINLEAYVNMKLNLKKCSFGVKKKEVPSLYGHIERSPGQSQEDKGGGRDAVSKNFERNAKPKSETSVQEINNLIVELPTLTTPGLKETLYVYLAASKDTVSGVLMADRKGKQTPIRSHPIRVITDQPIKQIINKPEVSEKLAKYAVELGAYNITYVPRNAIKSQVLADFLNEVPVGTKHLEVCSLIDGKSLEEWTLFTDGASSLKGARVGLVLIDPAGTEYTYVTG